MLTPGIHKLILFAGILFLSCQPSPSSINSKPSDIVTSNENEVKHYKESYQPPMRQKKTAFSVFFENSGSMDGYINGNTEYKDAIFKLLSDIFQQGYPTQYFIVNQEIYNLNNQVKQVQDFISFLNPQKIRTVGNTKSTEINKIIKMVVASLSQENQVAMIFSDYIYSVENNTNISNSLSENKYSTKAILRDIVNKDYSLLVIRLSSQFKGNYYDMKHPNEGNEIDEKRPAFIWVIGPKSELENFEKKFRIKELMGYTNALKFISIDKISKTKYYSILNRTNKKGSFSKADRESSVIHSIEDLRFDQRENKLQFSIALDISHLPNGYDYFNKKNYDVYSSIGDKFEVISIDPISKIDPNDNRYRGTATHIITISTSSLSKEIQKLYIGLKSHLPDWKDRFSTLDDTTPLGRKDKTFGINYLLEGVAEAFGYRSDTYFLKISLTLQK